MLCFGLVRQMVPPLLRQRRTRDVFFFVGHIWINVLWHSLMEDILYASWGKGTRTLSHYLQTSCFVLAWSGKWCLHSQGNVELGMFFFSLDIFESMCSGTRWWKIFCTPVEVKVHVLYPTIYKLHALFWLGQVNGASTPKATSNLGCFFFLVGHIWINVLRHSLMEDILYASWGKGTRSLSHYLQTSCFVLAWSGKWCLHS